jgi:hypothetical protein
MPDAAAAAAATAAAAAVAILLNLLPQKLARQGSQGLLSTIATRAWEAYSRVNYTIVHQPESMQIILKTMPDKNTVTTTALTALALALALALTHATQ